MGTLWNVYDANSMSAREVYGRVLAELGKENDKIVGVTADLAKSTNIGLFGEAFPDRFFNVGIAEQNMFGVAAGLAKTGLIPFASTFAIFSCLRGGEQVRTDICYQNLPVKIIATHSGVSFGVSGSTHHALEDIAIMKAIPNMTVVVPADGYETAKAVEQCIDIPGPVYIRIGRGFEPPLHDNQDFDFQLGKASILREGTDLTIICCGTTVLQALGAAEEAAANGVECRVINMHTIKPLDEEAVMNAVKDTRRILTIEEHNTIGGLGDAVGALIAESGKGCVFVKHGIPDQFSPIGLPEDLYAYFKLDSTGIAEKISEVMGKEFEEDDDWADED